MSSRTEILKNVRQQLVEAVELPALAGEWTTYADPTAQFAETLAGVGGQCVSVGAVAELNARLAEIPAYRDAAKIVSLVPDVGAPNVDVDAIDDPHDFADVDFAILPGQLAVAENAAVWVTDANLRHRVLYFLPQHVALVVPAGNVVNNLHEGYRWLADHAPEGANTLFDQPGFSAWISGPSKTADIEQSLVIGAHGARSLTIFLLG